MQIARLKKASGSIRKLSPLIVYGALFAIAAYMFALGVLNRLGADPLDRLIDFYGEGALKLLVVILLISPLRKIGLDLVKFRRALGVMAFFYIAVHFMLWAGISQGFEPNNIIKEIIKRPFITMGMVGMMLALPLAVTSNNFWVRKLNPKRWKRLHLLTYPLALLAGVHYLMVVKGWQPEPIIFLTLISLLLLYRLFRYLKSKAIHA